MRESARSVGPALDHGRSHGPVERGNVGPKGADLCAPLSRYVYGLRASVVASATPYGYTLTVWTSGAVLSHAHGIPAAPAALLFLAGAVLGYAVVGALAFTFVGDHVAAIPTRAVVSGALNLFSVGLAIGAVSLVAQVRGIAAWPLGGLVATAVYLGASAFQLSVAHAGRGEARLPEAGRPRSAR